MNISLVTTCRNEVGSLPRWQQDIQTQTRQPNEIVVVDAFSDDGTVERLFEWARTDKRIKVIQEKGAAAHGRNIAIEAATYDTVLSTDMGVRLCDLWCEELVRPFEEDPEVDIVVGSTQIDEETVRSVVSRAEYYIENGGEPVLEPGCIPGNRSVAYTKEVWRVLGGLPEDLTFYADDSVFGRQMVQSKFKMALAPLAMTYWARPQRFTQFWKEQYNYGQGDGEAAIKMPFVFRHYLQQRFPKSWVPFLHGLRIVSKQVSLDAMGRSLKKMDLAALAMMPVLAFGNGYHFARGYIQGYQHGEMHCQDCRDRLTDNWVPKKIGGLS